MTNETTKMDRRATLRAAAWAAPVVAVVAAAPLAAATGEPLPDATYIGRTFGNTVNTGRWNNIALFGYAYDDDDNQVDANLPSTVTVVVTPPPGGTVEARNLVTGSVVTNADGSITITFQGDVRQVTGQIRYTGTGTAEFDITTSDPRIADFHGTQIVE